MTIPSFHCQEHVYDGAARLSAERVRDARDNLGLIGMGSGRKGGPEQMQSVALAVANAPNAFVRVRLI